MTSGRWIVLDASTREVYGLHQDGTEPIQVVRFSPNGKLLALGSRDNIIYMYQVSDKYRKLSRLGRCMVSGKDSLEYVIIHQSYIKWFRLSNVLYIYVSVMGILTTKGENNIVCCIFFSNNIRAIRGGGELQVMVLLTHWRYVK